MVAAPVLLLVYNRLDTLQQLWEILRIVKPRYLFVSADGPRDTSQDRERTHMVRKFVQSEIDWKCEAAFNFFSENQGCKMGVSGGISWFFSQVEAGIILEDDVLPHPTFFTYAEEMLERYAAEPRVGGIGGLQLFPGWRYFAGAWDFIRLPLIWGWATWRRVWQHYSPDIPEWQQLKAQHFPDTRFSHPRQGHFLCRLMDIIQSGGDTWDFQLTLLFLRENWLFALPSRNLVRNIGYAHPLAYHTHGRSWVSYLPVETWTGGLPPLSLSPNLAYERLLFERLWTPSLWRRIQNRLRTEWLHFREKYLHSDPF